MADADAQGQSGCMQPNAGNLICKGPLHTTHMAILGVPRKFLQCGVHYAYAEQLTREHGDADLSSVLGAGAHTAPVSTPTHCQLPWGEKVAWPDVRRELIEWGFTEVSSSRKVPNYLLLHFVQRRTHERARALALDSTT